MEQAKRGDEGAFGVLVERYSGRLYGAMLVLTRNPQDAEDITQEAFIRALQRIYSFRGDSSFSTWLHRIAYNLAYDQARKKREYAVDEPWVAEGSSDEEGFAQVAHRAELFQALRILNPSHQKVLVLRHGEGYSIKEIAKILGLSEGTVKSRLYNSYRRLREELTRLRGD